MPPSLHCCDGRVFTALSGFRWMKQFLGWVLAKIIFSPQIKKNNLFYDCFMGPTIKCVLSGHSPHSLSLPVAAGLKHCVLALYLVLCSAYSCPLTCGLQKSRKEIIFTFYMFNEGCVFSSLTQTLACWCVSLFTLGKTQLPFWQWYGLTSLIKRIAKIAEHQRALMRHHFVECKRIWNIWIKFLLKYIHPS